MLNQKIILGYLLMSLLLFSGSCGKKKKPGFMRQAKAARVDLRDVSTNAGILQPKIKVDLKSEVSGIVKKIFIREGDTLHRESPILEIDPTLLLNEKEKLQLRVRRSELEYKMSLRNLENIEKLESKGATSRRELLDLRDQTELKKNSFEETKLGLENILVQLQKTILKAPMSGVLISLEVEEGEIVVSATQGSSGGTMIGTLADLSQMEVICQIGELDYASVYPGQKVTIILESQADKAISGAVSFVASSAKEAKNSVIRMFEVRIDVDSLTAKIVPGMNVTVNFLMLERNNVLGIPFDLVYHEDVDGKRKYYVFTKNQNKTPQKRYVEIGATDFKFLEIMSGLSEGEIVVPNPKQDSEKTGKDVRKYH